MAQTNKQLTQLHLTLHELLSALSFWGTTVRFLLFLFLAGVTFLVALAQTVAPQEEVGLFIYALATFLVFDAGYVMLSRGLPLTRIIDQLVVVVFELVFTVAHVVPYFALVPTAITAVVIWAPLGVVGLLSLRALLGLLYSRSA